MDFEKLIFASLADYRKRDNAIGATIGLRPGGHKNLVLQQETIPEEYVEDDNRSERNDGVNENDGVKRNEGILIVG